MIRVGHLDTGVDPTAVPVAAWAWTDRRGRIVEDGRPCDPEGHGTATAEAITAQAPSAALHSIAVMHGGDVIARILAGLHWVLDQQVHIVCLPLGLRESNPVLDLSIEKLRDAGVLLIAAVGNGGAGRVREPAAHPAVLAVGASDDSGRVMRDSGSAFDRHWVIRKPDLVAPSARGTSLACARMVGLAAHLWAEFPDATADDIQTALTMTAAAVPDDQQHRVAHGKADADAAADWLRTGKRSAESRQIEWPVRSYQDPRLTRKLKLAEHDELISAVLVDVEVDVVRMRAVELERWIRTRRPRIASAADIDLWAHILER